MKYIVVEIQKMANGQIATLTDSFDNLNAAEAKFHNVLAAAAVSNIPVHSCMLMSETAFPMRNECYNHEVSE